MNYLLPGPIKAHQMCGIRVFNAKNEAFDHIHVPWSESERFISGFRNDSNAHRIEIEAAQLVVLLRQGPCDNWKRAGKPRRLNA